MKLTFRGNGKIYSNEKEYECSLYLNEQEGGALLNITVRGFGSNFLEFPLECDFLTGELSTGYKFTFIECYRTGTRDDLSADKTTFTYQSKFFLKGIGGKEYQETIFNKVSFCIPKIIDWGGLSCYKLNENMRVSDNEIRKTKLFEDDRLIVHYEVYGSYLPCDDSELLNEKIILEQKGYIVIELKGGAAIQAYERPFEQVKRLIELCKLEKISPTYVEGFSDGVYDEYNEKRYQRPIEIVYSGMREQTEEENNNGIHSYMWIELQDLISNNCFEHYFAVYEKIEPVIELYIEIIHMERTSAKRKFMNIIQALETFHSRMITNDLKEFKTRIDEVILAQRPEQCKEEDRKFLIGPSKSFITLESRMADLLLANFETHFDTGKIKFTDFPHVISTTRNYYTHYDEKIKERGHVLSNEELVEYNRSLFYLLEYHLLRTLGFNDIKNIQTNLYQRWGSVSWMLKMMEER